MFRYVTKVNYTYGMVNGKVVPVEKTVYRHDRFRKLSDLWDFTVNALLPACCIASVAIAFGVVICYLVQVW